MPKGKNENSGGLSRRRLLRQAVATGTALGAFSGGMPPPINFVQRAFAAEHPPIGTWPEGASGSSVTVGIAVPRTGTYAESGEDELKGMELAIEHINEGHDLIKKISPKTKKGVLGKEVKYLVADSEAKPNTAVQDQSRFITENKVIVMIGSTSSAVAVAMNKLAEREKVIYLTGISGSNDTTGKDCVRYGFRQNFYGPDRGSRDRPGPAEEFWQEQKSSVHDAGLYLRPHRYQVGE